MDGDAGTPALRISRRTLLKAAGAGLATSALSAVGPLAWLPERIAAAVPPGLPDIQHDIGAYLAPARTIDGTLFRFGPVHTAFVTLRLRRTPGIADQRALASALARLEQSYPFRPEGVFTFVSYGIPYFRRLPDTLVARHLPTLLEDPTRPVLEEAVPAPTDVVAGNGVTKQRFNVPVVIEDNDVLLTVRSDRAEHLRDVISWLFEDSAELCGQRVASPRLEDLFEVTTVRAMFAQPGLPRKVAEAAGLPFASRINRESPMWMGFADPQVAGSGPASITTFAGNASARLTSATTGDYFDNASVQVLSHVILDLAQFYADEEPYTERVQYMFRSDPIPSTEYHDQYTDGGGPAYFPNLFRGAGDAERNAQGDGTYDSARRMGHLAALQRSSRAADGTPLHMRMDGPGFDPMDVPDGSAQPKLQFTAFVPTAQRFRRMRRDQASLDLVKKYGVQDDDDGLERFLTATRRQNFLAPPRRHRAFPLVEFS